MRIGILSDTHIPEAMPELWPQVLSELKDVDVILHAGDIYEYSVLDQLEKIAPVYAALGNGDEGSGGREEQPQDPRVKKSWLLNLNSFSIGLTHHIPIPEIPPNLTVKKWKQRLFPSVDLDVLIYGDTHVEQIDRIDNTLCINPGSPTFPHNLNTQLGTIGLLDLNHERPKAEIRQLTENGSIPFNWANSKRPW